MPDGPPPGKAVFRALVKEADTGLNRVTQVVAATADDAVGLVMEAVEGVPVADPVEWWDRFSISSITQECVGDRK